MEKETRAQRVKRLIEKHVRDRNMDPRSIDEQYSKIHHGIQIDPDFFEIRLSMGWGFFKDEPRHLDHMTRQIVISCLLAHRDRPGCFHQGKKGVMMGVTFEQMMEAYEVASYPGGGPVITNGLPALKRMVEEGITPGCQPGPWNGVWLKLGPYQMPLKEPLKTSFTPSNSGSRFDQIMEKIKHYNPDETGEFARDFAYGVNLDPVYFEGFVRLSWSFVDEKERQLDPIRHELIMIPIFAYRGMSQEVYNHTKKALSLGATPVQILEALQVGCVGGGSQVLMEGLRALRLIHEEQAGS